MLRVLTGKFKNSILKVNKSVRPIPGMVRKAVMDMFREEIVNGIIGDFFAGSGSFGIEALSNGAEKVFFFEKNAKVINVLKDNLCKLQLEKKIEIVRIDLFREMNKIEGYNFNVSFISPPFIAYREKNNLQKLIMLYTVITCISKISILQFPKQTDRSIFSNLYFDLKVEQYIKNYGDNCILIRRKMI